jgi:hypothetical protein
MKIIQNEGIADRIIRLFLSEIGFLYAYFWTSGGVRAAVAGLSLVLLGTAALGFCGAYRLFGIDTRRVGAKPPTKALLGAVGLGLVAVAVLGGYSSIFLTEKIFLEDFNAMNRFYKQALFFTGQEKLAEARINYTQLVSEYDSFRRTYRRYHPFVLSSDANLRTDLDRVAGLITATDEMIVDGHLKSAHLQLEQVRPIFQEIFRRNGFSMLAVSLVDFHDAMEKILSAADKRDTARVATLYPEVNGKLVAVEETANDEEIKSIRHHLEQLAALAREGRLEALPAKAAELKSSFVKVYLKRG